MKKVTAIGYCRRSTRDMQENSLEIQEEIIRRYAREQGIEILKIFSDKASGRQVKGRDSFLELLEWVEGKDFQKILVSGPWSTTRPKRSPVAIKGGRILPQNG